ncbi:tetratricopeptide repeat protein [Schleiferiaceae bacterium]|nr:tetratricopeptide repeat protein [Schleiferiaceae bacterium]MDB4124294.1 tetratricopeptide repeat protein [Schleiferiaceae bacterium]MDB4177060.1 tetratricopeptide repeat protein [Schleiferiaceae bacterium]MDC0083056.1 tetratricopeptide repeat protein [Schleiferiaceae bacterium]MDC1225924.1 tetratricopeptide repeat protein [Schleiferiaceae bacterium]
MKKSVLLLFTICFGPLGFSQDYQEQFLTAFESGNDSTQHVVLDAWKLATPQDAEYFVAEFNYHVNLAYSEVMGILPDPPQGEAFAITDSTGEVVGYMGSYMSWDSVHTDMAVQVIREGIAVYPNRLDMHFGYIHFLGQAKLWEDFAGGIEAVLAQDDSNNHSWLWSDNEQFNEPDFPSFFQDYQVTLFNEQDPSLFPYNIRISNAVLKYYPEDIPSITNLGVIAYYQEDLESATTHFQHALDLDPTDMIVVFNLAYMYETLGEVDKAIATYELALASEDPEASEQAKAIIAELRK